jgi:hypothetical protein
MDTPHRLIESEEFQPSRWEDRPLAGSEFDPATVEIDHDAALKHRDEKKDILASRSVPTAREIHRSSEHVKIVPS